MNGISTLLSRLLTGSRTTYVALIVLVGIVLLAGPLAGKVADVEENGPTSVLPRGAESTLVEEQLPGFATDGVQPAVVVWERDGGLTADDRAALDDVRRDAEDGMAAPGSVTEPRVSEDGESATVAVGIDITEDDSFDSIEQLRADAAAAAPDGVSSHLTGPAALFYDEISVFDGLDTTILLASVLVVAVLLLLTYRSPVLWVLPLVTIGVAMVLSQAAIYLLAEHADLPVDGQSGGILPILVFGVGTDYALLLVSRYREQLALSPDRHVAMALAVRRTAPAVLASAGTVALGLACLLLADLNSTRSLGAVGAIGVAGAAVAMLSVLPVLMVLLGRWVFWPYVPHVGDAVHTDDHADRGARRWQRLAALLERRARPVWVGTAAVLGVLALSVGALDVGTGDAGAFRENPDSVVGQRVLSEHFAAGSSAPAYVVTDADSADAVVRAVASTPGVAGVSPSRPAADGSSVLLQTVLADAPDSAAAEGTVEALRTELDAVGGDALVGGPTAETLDVAQASRDDAMLVIPAVLAVVLLVLVLLLRAVVGPLVLLGTVLLSYVTALGVGGLVMGAMGIRAVDVSLPLLAFVLLVTLGVDYTIFLMSRVREEALAHGHAAGVRRGLVSTGGVVTSAGIVLAATFGVTWQLPIVFIVGIGVVVSLGILIDTFVVRSLLVPALALDLGDRFWWPSRLPTPEPTPSSGGDTLGTRRTDRRDSATRAPADGEGVRAGTGHRA